MEDPETGWHHGNYWKWSLFELLTEVALRDGSIGVPLWVRFPLMDLLDRHDEAMAEAREAEEVAA